MVENILAEEQDNPTVGDSYTLQTQIADAHSKAEHTLSMRTRMNNTRNTRLEETPIEFKATSSRSHRKSKLVTYFARP